MVSPMRVAFLTSGDGAGIIVMLEMHRCGQLPNVMPVCVITSNEQGLITKLENIETVAFDTTHYSDSEESGKHLLEILQNRTIDFIGQYEWRVHTPRSVIEAYAGRSANYHPGPLDPGYPDFGGYWMYGRRVCAARLEFVKKTQRDWWTEATVQRVGFDFRSGALLLRQRVPILPDDTPETLEQRVCPVGVYLFMQTLEPFAQGKVTEHRREDRLVRPEELPLLAEAFQAARLLYPNG